MAPFLPEIVADILSRLPVKPLLCFRCVSKPWCALIDSPSFVKLHLKRSKETKNNNGILLLIDRSPPSVGLLCMHSLDVAVQLDDHPLKNRTSTTGPLVEGSCDGLVLLWDKHLGDVTIWNPSTRKYHKLPIITDDTHHLKPADHYNIVCGLGYDEVHDDYKVVKIVQYIAMDGKTFCSEVWVYSLKLSSWRRIRDFPYYLYYNRFYGNFAGGALHWIVSRDRKFPSYDCIIVAVDLSSEEYHLVPMPNILDKYFHMGVSVLNGCLCILCNYSDKRFDVWVMKEYGVRESWNKLVSVALPKCTWPLEFVVPLDFSKDGTKVLLLQCSIKLIWFDLKRKEVHEMGNVCGLPKLFGAAFYQQSLVQGSNAKKQPREESKGTKPRRIEKKRDGFLSKGFKLKL